MVACELSPFIVGASRTAIFGDDGKSAATFARYRALTCPNALEPEFLSLLNSIGERAQFLSDQVDGLGHREIETPNIAGAALTLALRRDNLMRWIEDVTQCGPLVDIGGHVVQTRCVAGDRLAWHDDLNARGRCLAITINLSRHAYEGGWFELRRVGSREVLWRYRHTIPGAAVIFEIARDLEHRVTPLTKGGPRRVYAGWFIREE